MHMVPCHVHRVLLWSCPMLLWESGMLPVGRFEAKPP